MASKRGLPSLPRLATFVGETARPYVLIVAGSSAATATVQTAIYNANIEGAAFVAACWAGVAAIYHSKSREEVAKAEALASVETAKAQAHG